MWLSYFFDYGMSFVGGAIAWRLPVACQMIFAFVSSAFWMDFKAGPKSRRLSLHLFLAFLNRRDFSTKSDDMRRPCRSSAMYMVCLKTTRRFKPSRQRSLRQCLWRH